ncbi:hypothetical protein HAX54_016918 [Datura stramonium]|uniref:Uncharacterized protein n=1 Tax=Datura stramonium TaxID=4076 RepID=A0ABS8RJ31_DATST|nr:hypothetical protein [Datura stramonium]
MAVTAADISSTKTAALVVLLEMDFALAVLVVNLISTCNVRLVRVGSLWINTCINWGSTSCAIISPEVGVFPRQQHPNPYPAVEMINSVSDAHERLIAAQLRAQIEARGREAALDLL